MTKNCETHVLHQELHDIAALYQSGQLSLTYPTNLFLGVQLKIALDALKAQGQEAPPAFRKTLPPPIFVDIRAPPPPSSRGQQWAPDEDSFSPRDVPVTPKGGGVLFKATSSTAAHFLDPSNDPSSEQDRCPPSPF